MGAVLAITSALMYEFKKQILNIVLLLIVYFVGNCILTILADASYNKGSRLNSTRERVRIEHTAAPRAAAPRTAASRTAVPRTAEPRAKQSGTMTAYRVSRTYRK